MTLDPVSLPVLLARLAGVADEMSTVLRRSAYSPNIKERADCSSAVFTAEGELLAQAENIPVHLGSMPASVKAAIDAFEGGGSLAPGDQVILNDPFSGGTHLNDVTVVAPAFVDDPRADGGRRLLGWVANRAHHADVGGAAPGSLPADAVEVFEEGLRIPPLRLTDGVTALVLANSRTPAERAGDLEAQIGANRVGVARLITMVGEPFDEVLDYGERRMRSALAELPSGSWSFEDVVDSFGPAEHQQVATTIRVRLTITPEGITFDFTGTDPQRRGNVNAVEAVTVSAVVFAVRSVLDPTIPANGGALRPIRVVAPAGTIVHARSPAAVGAGNVEVSQRVADVCLGALAAAVPGSVGAAGQGTMNNLLIGGPTGAGPSGHEAWVYYETVGGGQGGRAGAAARRVSVGDGVGYGPRPAAEPAGPLTAPPSTVSVDPDDRYPAGSPTPSPSEFPAAMTNPDRAATDAAGSLGSGTPGRSGIHTNMTNTVDEGHQSPVGVPGQSGIHTNMTNSVDEGHQRGEPMHGQSAIQVGMTNSRNTPAEVLERTYPMRVLRYRIREGSGGAGWARGGDGIERDLQVLEDVTVSLITERRVSQPWGLAGGEPGAVGENWLLPGGDEDRAERLPDKCTLRLAAGDVLRMLTPGGGGWGSPLR